MHSNIQWNVMPPAGGLFLPPCILASLPLLLIYPLKIRNHSNSLKTNGDHRF